MSNTGRKIPPGEAQTLLEPFVHGQGTRVRTDGLGLGLSIVHAITLAHRGRIAVTARTGGGLDITIDLAHDSHDGRTVGTMTQCGIRHPP
ncbi:ATP-binding protein [Nonomuraea sp. NPDC003709]|uniref:ATP-binding protein n=1 Tax=Nonomuraea sp. NPDC003709 TaxID=3154450 RepID=UPI0033A36C8E